MPENDENCVEKTDLRSSFVGKDAHKKCHIKNCAELIYPVATGPLS
jgi:hypothetical protein